MEGTISCMDSFQLLSTLSFTARTGFAREGYVHMALFFSALAFCFWGFVLGWWRKHAQSVFVLSLSSCFSLKYNATRHQISRVPAMRVAVDRAPPANNQTVYCINTGTNVAAEETESVSRGKIYMRFERSLQNSEELPANEFPQNRGARVPDCTNSVTSFSSPTDKQISGLGNCRNYIVQDTYEEAAIEGPTKDLLKLFLLPEDIVRFVDVSWGREVLATSTVDSSNTVRLWDVPASTCLNYMKFSDTTVIAAAHFSNSPHVHLLGGIGIAEEKSSLYVCDTRNFLKPLSFSLGRSSRFDIVDFNDRKVYVCDDLSERVFDLRMGGAPVLQVYPGIHRRERLTPPCFVDEETASQLRNSFNSQDFGLYTSSLLL